MAEQDTAAGGTPPAADPPPAPKAPPAKKPASDPPAPPKLELTQEELDARISAALKAKEDKDAAAKQREKEEADRRAAEEQGRFKELHDAERQKREAAEREALKLRTDLKRSEVKDQIRDYLREHNPDYVGAEKWILPLVEFDLATAPEDLTKRVKQQSDAYVKDNPRARNAPPPPPGGPHGGAGTQQPKKPGDPNNKEPFRITGAAARF